MDHRRVKGIDSTLLSCMLTQPPLDPTSKETIRWCHQGGPSRSQIFQCLSSQWPTVFSTQWIHEVRKLECAFTLFLKQGITLDFPWRLGGESNSIGLGVVFPNSQSKLLASELQNLRDVPVNFLCLTIMTTMEVTMTTTKAAATTTITRSTKV